MAFLACAGAVAAQQRPNTFGIVSDQEYTPDGSENERYNGKVQFVRLSYQYGLANFGFGGRGARLAPWAHDYPRADRHFMKIMEDLTLLRPRTDGSNTFALDDPELMLYPLSYMSEPGYWRPTESEVLGLRHYLQKGGFIIFDDFRGPDWDNLQRQMSRVLPENPWVQLDGRDQVFHAFFEIPDVDVLEPPYGGLPALYYGIYEQNDRSKRLMAIANVNNDMGEYWEYSDTGWAPVDLSNEAYKFGVNYAMYAMTH